MINIEKFTTPMNWDSKSDEALYAGEYGISVYSTKQNKVLFETRNNPRYTFNGGCYSITPDENGREAYVMYQHDAHYAQYFENRINLFFLQELYEGLAFLVNLKQITLVNDKIKYGDHGIGSFTKLIEKDHRLANLTFVPNEYCKHLFVFTLDGKDLFSCPERDFFDLYNNLKAIFT